MDRMSFDLGIDSSLLIVDGSQNSILFLMDYLLIKGLDCFNIGLGYT
jgi:hypothetical protein